VLGLGQLCAAKIGLKLDMTGRGDQEGVKYGFDHQSRIGLI